MIRWKATWHRNQKYAPRLTLFWEYYWSSFVLGRRLLFKEKDQPHIIIILVGIVPLRTGCSGHQDNVELVHEYMNAFESIAATYGQLSVLPHNRHNWKLFSWNRSWLNDFQIIKKGLNPFLFCFNSSSLRHNALHLINEAPETSFHIIYQRLDIGYRPYHRLSGNWRCRPVFLSFSSSGSPTNVLVEERYPLNRSTSCKNT